MTARSLFIRWLAVATVVGALLLTACTPETSSTGSQTTPAATTVAKATATAASTKPTGSLILSLSFAQNKLDPQDASPNTFQALSGAFFDSLIELTAEGKTRPGLAEKWEISADGKSHTFFIKKGIKFQDGSALTGADVKFSLERMLDPKNVHTDGPYWIRMVASVDLKDDYTVVINLKQALFELMLGLDAASGAGAIVPKKYYEEKGKDYFATHPMGSGPWKLVKWEPGIRLDLEANENYWGTLPKVKNVSLMNIGDEATRVAMLKTGELDLAEVAPDSAAGLKSAGLKIIAHDGGSQVLGMMWYDPAHPEAFAIGNQKVRNALSMAINRQEMADKLFAGYAAPSAIIYVRPTAYFWDSSQLKPDPYDLEGAKKLMAEAGYPNGFQTKLWDLNLGVVSSNIVQAISGYWQKLGVKGDVTNGDYAALVRQLQDTVPTAWNGFRFPTAAGGIWNFERMPATYTLGFYGNKANKDLDALVNKVLATSDPAQRKTLALQAAVTAKANNDVLAILDVRTVFAVGKKVGNFQPITGMAGLAGALSTMTVAP